MKKKYEKKYAKGGKSFHTVVYYGLNFRFYGFSALPCRRNQYSLSTQVLNQAFAEFFNFCLFFGRCPLQRVGQEQMLFEFLNTQKFCKIFCSFYSPIASVSCVKGKFFTLKVFLVLFDERFYWRCNLRSPDWRCKNDRIIQWTVKVIRLEFRIYAPCCMNSAKKIL